MPEATLVDGTVDVLLYNDMTRTGEVDPIT